MFPLNNLFIESKYELNDLVERNNETHYPPYNAWLEEDGNCIVEIAVAGFSKEELKIELRDQLLFVVGEKEVQKDKPTSNRKWIKHGLAERKFIRKFEVLGYFLIERAVLKNGILTIILKNETKTSTVNIRDEW